MTRQVSDVVEEGKGSITMTCSADANPPARIFWRKYDGTDESQFVETLSFNPVIFLFLQDCQTSLSYRRFTSNEVFICRERLAISESEELKFNMYCKSSNFSSFARLPN